MMNMQSKEAVLAPIIRTLGLDEACTQLLDKNEEINPYGITQIQDIYTLISHIGEALDVGERARSLVDELEERINIVIHKLKFIEASQKSKVLLAVDNQLQQDIDDPYQRLLIEAAGGRSYKSVLGDDNPGIIIVLAKDQNMYQLLSGLPLVLAEEEWRHTDAIKNNKVFLVDGQRKLDGNLVRVADDIELLAEIIFPQYFVFGEQGESWMKFEL